MAALTFPPVVILLKLTVPTAATLQALAEATRSPPGLVSTHLEFARPVESVLRLGIMASGTGVVIPVPGTLVALIWPVPVAPRDAPLPTVMVAVVLVPPVISVKALLPPVPPVTPVIVIQGIPEQLWKL
jgi:hypothetical protein